jgi:hypothetical protein
MIYITKFSICLSFIYRYSQTFNVVSSCHAADVPSVRDFVSNSRNHVRIMVATAFVIRARSFSRLAETDRTNTLPLT